MSDKRTVLRGLQPQPLASYLGALGVLRLCGEQHDPSVRGAFGPEGFVLEGIAPDELRDLLLRSYAPTPVLTPWNNASGFYDSSKGRQATAAMETLLASGDQRFEGLSEAILQARALIASLGYAEAPKDDDKASFMASLRGVLTDRAVDWLDAVAVVADNDARMMPLLGSGGNEGVLDYSGLFLRSLVEVLLGRPEASRALLEAAINAAPTDALIERPGGQFDPGTAGGFNTGPGFETKGLPNNPWAFILLVEGALLWASAIASRQEGSESSYRFAVSPFTVRHRAAGYGSAGSSDDDPQRVRAEVWVPVWRRPTTVRELGRFIAEGRVDVRTRRGVTRASDSLDFADAVGSLGVDRGVDSFVRYTFIKRRGDAFIALPTGVLDVHHRREVDLIRQLDGELAILDAFLRRFPGDGPPAQLVSRRRAIDEARFDVAQRGGPDAMRGLVRAIGALELVLARRDPGKEPKLNRPLGGLGAEWIEACGESTEVRLAAALASIAPTGGAGPIRMYLTPLDPKDPRRFAPAPRSLAWQGTTLADRLGSVLRRRILDSRRTTEGGTRSGRNPVYGVRRADLSDLALFLAEDLVDARALEELLFGFTWVKPGPGSGSRNLDDRVPPLPRAYALLKLLFTAEGLPKGEDQVIVTPDPALLTLLSTGRVSDAVALARSQLMAKGFRPRHVIDRDVEDPDLGRRLAAALLIPVQGLHALMRAALVPVADSDTSSNLANTEI